MTDYTSLCADLQAMVSDVPHPIASLANASALLATYLEDVNWVGFYLMEDGALVLGPFQGKPACVRIAVGEGVCGTAVQHRASVLVEDVHAFAGHIACDSASNSELVVPILVRDTVVGVLDIDSPSYARFTDEDRIGMEQVAQILAHDVLGGAL